jgi:hypothetical protein
MIMTIKQSIGDIPIYLGAVFNNPKINSNKNNYSRYMTQILDQESRQFKQISLAFEKLENILETCTNFSGF